jgi:crossover junction endodeoxyribonuclease RuvC
MIVLGFDPGLERAGYGAVRREGSGLTPVRFGIIETPRVALADRLALIRQEVISLIDGIAPDRLATERLLFSVNRKTAMDVAAARGVILEAGASAGFVWAEYAPQEIKLSVAGNGAAAKGQVQYMVAKLLGLAAPPGSDDAADALAIAICHALRERPGAA